MDQESKGKQVLLLPNTFLSVTIIFFPLQQIVKMTNANYHALSDNFVIMFVMDKKCSQLGKCFANLSKKYIYLLVITYISNHSNCIILSIMFFNAYNFSLFNQHIAGGHWPSWQV